MNEWFLTVFAIIFTIIIYIFAVKLYQKIHIALFLPVAVATLLVILVLIMFNISYEEYMIGGRWIDLFLGPAIVALAFPLYRNINILKKYMFPLLWGTFSGACVGILTGVYITKGLGFSKDIIYSILPKSVTTPVAMDISLQITGIPSLAAVFVMIAGISGAMASQLIFRIGRIESNIGRGVSFGSASHAIGTARAFENNEEQGSVSTVAMIFSAIFVSILAPIFIQLL